MNYKAFSGRLNYSRKANELLGTRSRTDDRVQTDGGYSGPGDQMRIIKNEDTKGLQAKSRGTNGVNVSHGSSLYMKTTCDMESRQTDCNSRITSTKTLQILLEQYLSETSPSSPFSEILSQRNKFEEKHDSAITEKAQDHGASQVPPPLLHRPKRSLEHDHLNTTSSGCKHPRLGTYYDFSEQNYGRALKGPSNTREQMFEKTRSPAGNSLKPPGPPPPLLKQTPVNSNAPKLQRGPYTHNAKEVSHDPAVEWSVVSNNEGCKNRTASLEPVVRNKRALDHRFQQNGSVSSQLASSAAKGKQNVVTAQPLPRQIAADDESSCGGYAFDHTAMPKIVAVHSVSRGKLDEDEWKRNKAFISKVKGAQDKSYPSRAPLEGREHEKINEVSHFKTTSVSSQNPQSFVQDLHGYKDTNLSDCSNIGKSSTEVSFERFVLYHLLSKFQGNVEQVKRVLKENLLQEWLAYYQGNIEPTQQTLNGVSFVELRKLYEIWCQLQISQRKNGNQSDCLEAILKSQNSEPNHIKPDSRLVFQKNQDIDNGNSQRSLSSQHFKEISQPQRNCSSRNVSGLNHAVLQTRNPSPVPLRLQRGNDDVIGRDTRNMSIKNLPLPIVEEIYSLSQSSSLNGKVCSKPTPPSASPSPQNQNDVRTPGGYRQNQSSTNQVFASNGKQVTFNESTTSGGNANMRQTHSVSGYPERKDVERDTIRGTKLPPCASVLQHFPQTTSKPMQHESLSFENLTRSSENTIFRNSVVGSSCRESARSHHHPLQESMLQESLGNDVAREQETKATYLWRFKGGKLISDNMTSNNAGEGVTEIELNSIVSEPEKSNEINVTMEVKREDHTSGQHSCHRESASHSFRQTSHPVILAAEQQHKKVCGAAASGKPCYCVLELKDGPQSRPTSINPIQSMQQMINRAADSSSRERDTQSHIQKPKTKAKAANSIVATDSSQLYHRPSAIVRISRNTQETNQSNARVNVSFNGQTSQQPKASVHVTRNTLVNQPSYNTVNSARNAQENKQSIVSLHPSFPAQASRRSDFDISANEQAHQPSNADVQVLGIVKEQSNGNFHVSCKIQTNQQPNSNLHVQRHEPTTKQPNSNQLEFPRDEQINHPLIRCYHTSRDSESKPQPVGNSRVDISDQKLNPISKLKHTAQVQQLSNGSLQVSRNPQLSQQSNINRNVSKFPTTAVVRIAPKVEPGTSCEKEKLKRTDTSMAIRSQKANDKNCSFLRPLAPKKQYNSLQELAKKVIETRKRFEMERIPWKKKILKSLEGVLMKRLRKIEKDTGEQANLDGRNSSETETDKTEQQKNI